MTLLKIIAILVLVGVGLQAWVRFAPLPTARLAGTPGPDAPGVHPMMGGVKVVRPLSELPDDAFDRLVAIAQATPRTLRHGAGSDPAVFVTRSRLWGFPDIALVWVADGHLHLHSHLVFGKGDMGVNAARVAGWMDRLDADQR